MPSIMRPRVTKRERKLHLSYELPHRIHTSLIYPLTAPNGSTVIIYAHDQGLRVLWRGGRRRKTVAPQTNGTSMADIIVIDGDDDGEQTAQEDDGFEAEEEEQDPDCPYPGILQDLDLPTGNDVLRLAIPSIHESALTPQLLKSVAVVAMSSADGALRILQIPLLPPADDAKDEVLGEIARSQVELVASGSIATDVAVKFLPEDDQSLYARNTQAENVEGQLLVASATRSLGVWSVSVTANALLAEDKTLVRRVPLQSTVTGLDFHPSVRSTQLLIADRNGAVRIYDPYALKTPTRRPGSSDSAAAPIGSLEPGKWVMAFHTTYSSEQGPQVGLASSRRTKILAAKWILGGKGIFALLEDGHWGIWDSGGVSRPGKGVESFAIDGWLTSATSAEPLEPAAPRKGASKLAPMTPNTRKAKAEQLFTGSSKAPGTASKGGISVASNNLKSGQADESVALWYDGDMYSVVSIQSFWQCSRTETGAFGSLYATGLSHITDINLNDEEITAICQFRAKSSTAGIGQMNTQRDILVSGEHRAIMLQSLRPPTPALFQEPRVHPQIQMRDTGKIQLATIASLDRALDDMAAGNNGPRRVGFTH